MKIALAQIQSAAGMLRDNIEQHLEFSATAAEHGAGVIVFPELSLTGYEPALAREFAIKLSDPRLEPIKAAASVLNLVISVGAPLQTNRLPQISMLSFFPDGVCQVYCKQKLSPDELPFFSAGSNDCVLQIEGINLLPGICFETRFVDPYKKARTMGASCFIASAAKPLKDIDAAYVHYSNSSKNFSLITVFVNAVGPADNFISIGRSGAWNEQGELIGSMTEADQGLLVVDTNSKTAKKVLRSRVASA